MGPAAPRPLRPRPARRRRAPARAPQRADASSARMRAAHAPLSGSTSAHRLQTDHGELARRGERERLGQGGAPSTGRHVVQQESPAASGQRRSADGHGGDVQAELQRELLLERGEESRFAGAAPRLCRTGPQRAPARAGSPRPPRARPAAVHPQARPGPRPGPRSRRPGTAGGSGAPREQEAPRRRRGSPGPGRAAPARPGPPREKHSAATAASARGSEKSWRPSSAGEAPTLLLGRDARHRHAGRDARRGGPGSAPPARRRWRAARTPRRRLERKPACQSGHQAARHVDEHDRHPRQRVPFTNLSAPSMAP